jgi:predicted nucleic acid-binding protein
MSEAEKLEFVDTNILVYAHDSSAGLKHQRALLQDRWQHQTGCLSMPALQGLCAIFTRKIGFRLTPREEAVLAARSLMTEAT